jgi:competence protein ComEA
MNKWLEEHRVLVLTLVGLLVVGTAAALFIRWKPAEPIVIEPPLPTPTPGPIQVYVSGAVAHPDVYTLPAGAIVQAALEAAGGPDGDADLEHLNLARPLKDGEHVYVPRVGEAPTPPAEGGPTVVTGPVNINIATQTELETLPGIGPVLAGRIIEYREANGPFGSIEDIQNVPGIGPSIFEDIKESIMVN